jgi:hypothetical protein
MFSSGYALLPYPQVIQLSKRPGHRTEESIPSTFLEQLAFRIREASGFKNNMSWPLEAKCDS